MSVIDRMLKIADFKGVSANKLTELLDVSGTYFYKQKTNNGNVGSQILMKIVDTYPDINPEWLLTGRGSMLRSDNTLPIAMPSSKGIPLIPLDAIGGLGAEMSYQILDSEIEDRYVVPDFDRVKPDYLIRVKGSSMSPKYNSGDLIAIKRIPLNDFIQWNKPYVLDTETQGILVKRILQSPTQGCFELVSDNKKYKPFDVPIKKIRSIFLVVGLIRLE